MLTLYGHPISSYTWKVLTALYENDTPFVPFTIDQNTYPEFIAFWPIGKFPVLRDGDRKTLVTETAHRSVSRTVEAAAIFCSCGKGIRATLPPLSGRLKLRSSSKSGWVKGRLHRRPMTTSAQNR